MKPVNVVVWLKKLDHILVGDYSFGLGTRRYIALFALVVACVVGGVTYSVEGWLRSRSFSLMPGFLSTSVALFILGALYARGLFAFKINLYAILLFILNLTVTAMMVKAFLGEAAPFFVKIPMRFLLIAAVIFSWVAIRPLAPFGWIAIGVIGLINVQYADVAMGAWGYVFVAAVGLSSALQLSENIGNVAKQLKTDFLGQDARHAIKQPAPNLGNGKARNMLSPQGFDTSA